MCGPLHLKKGQISIFGGDVVFHIPFKKFPTVQSVTVFWNGPFLLKHLSFSDRPHSVWVPCPPHAALYLTFWHLENAGGFGGFCWFSLGSSHLFLGPSKVAQLWRIRLPMQEMQETRVDPWVGKTPWRRKMTTHSSILAWRIPRPEKPGGL